MRPELTTNERIPEHQLLTGNLGFSQSHAIINLPYKDSFRWLSLGGVNEAGQVTMEFQFIK